MRQTASVFVDTSGWAAPLVTDAPNQRDMAVYSRTLVAEGRQLVTTNYVLSDHRSHCSLGMANAHLG